MYTRSQTSGSAAAKERQRRAWAAGELMDLTRRFNQSDDETMVVPANYLEVVEIRR